MTSCGGGVAPYESIALVLESLFLIFATPCLPYLLHVVYKLEHEIKLLSNEVAELVDELREEGSASHLLLWLNQKVTLSESQDVPDDTVLLKQLLPLAEALATLSKCP